jgi:hypothetical protein
MFIDTILNGFEDFFFLTSLEEISITYITTFTFYITLFIIYYYLNKKITTKQFFFLLFSLFYTNHYYYYC